jgi:thymidylate synthase
MNNLDKDYTSLLKDILENGVQKGDRTGTGTLSVFGRQIRHKMSDGFPLLTTKKMYWKGIVTELLWFLRGDTNIKFLVDNGCHIWDGDAYKNYLKHTISGVEGGLDRIAGYMDGCLVEFDGHYEHFSTNPSFAYGFRPYSQEEFINKIKTDDEFAKKWGELGPIYGRQWRNWGGKQVSVKEGKVITSVNDQIAILINDLKNNPDSRRLMVNAWNVGELDQMVLPPCHYGFQVYTRELSSDERYNLLSESEKKNFIIAMRPMMSPDDKYDEVHYTIDNYYEHIPKRAISLMWNQRSVDTFLGLPFNIASYGLLLEIIARAVNMVPDELIGNLGDVHLYSNHIEQAKVQIGRELTNEERYNIWFTNNYETGMERHFDLNNLPNYEDPYYIPTPKMSREPFDLPKLVIDKTESFWRVFDVSLFGHLDTNDFTIEDYKSHGTIKAPLSN